MNYQRQYEQKIGWKNSPDTSTPLNATNLGKMDNALNYMDEKLSEAIGGGIVEANPSETAEESLNKVAINGIVYGLSGGGGSYTAGNGISISNSVITNTRKGALTGVVDSISTNIAHTQIDNALTTTTAGALVVLKAEASGTSIDTVRVQYGAQASESNDFRLRDTSGNYTTIDIALDDTIIMMLNATGYQMIVLSILGASTGGGYAGLGIGKKTGVTSNVIDTDIDLHRAPIVGDRLLVYFDEKVTNPTGLITYNNGTAVTGNLENVIPLYINAGWNILEFKNDGLLYNNVWVKKLNVPLPISTLSGLTDTAIISPSDDQLLVYDNGKWKNKKFIEANVGFPVTELRKIEVDGIVYDTDGMRTYEASNVANDKISLSVINAYQFVQKVIAINTGAHSGSSNGWSLYISDGMEVANVALTRADGTPFADDIHENELLLVYVDTAGNVARVLDIPVDNTEVKTATGNPIMLTDAVAGNAIEVSAEIVATQSGSGTPSPTNIRPISGFSSVTITREDAQGQTATVTVSLGSTVYGGTLDLTSGELTVTHGYITKTWGQYIETTTLTNVKRRVLDAISDAKGSASDICDSCSYKLSWVDDYAHFYIDSTSKACVVFLPTNVDDSTEINICYELATPTTTTLTAEQLALVKGYNQLSCNSGDMEITYKASGLDALKERVDELEDRVDNLEDAVEDIEDRVDDVETALAGKANIEPYLEQSVTLSTSQTTTVTFTDARILATSFIDPAISVWGIFPEDVTVANGSCTVVMPKVSTAQTVTVGIFIKR